VLICRLELTLTSANHVFGYLHAVAATLPKMDAQIGQILWLPLLTLHIHALATLSPILQANFHLLLALTLCSCLFTHQTLCQATCSQSHDNALGFNVLVLHQD